MQHRRKEPRVLPVTSLSSLPVRNYPPDPRRGLGSPWRSSLVQKFHLARTKEARQFCGNTTAWLARFFQKFRHAKVRRLTIILSHILMMDRTSFLARMESFRTSIQRNLQILMCAVGLGHVNSTAYFSLWRHFHGRTGKNIPSFGK